MVSGREAGLHRGLIADELRGRDAGELEVLLRLVRAARRDVRIGTGVRIHVLLVVGVGLVDVRAGSDVEDDVDLVVRAGRGVVAVEGDGAELLEGVLGEEHHLGAVGLLQHVRPGGHLLAADVDLRPARELDVAAERDDLRRAAGDLLPVVEVLDELHRGDEHALPVGVDEGHAGVVDDVVLHLVADVGRRVGGVLRRPGEVHDARLALELGVALGGERHIVSLGEVCGVALAHEVELVGGDRAHVRGRLLHGDEHRLALDEDRRRDGLAGIVTLRAHHLVGDEAELAVVVALVGETGDVLGRANLVHEVVAGVGVLEALREEREKVQHRNLRV